MKLKPKYRPLSMFGKVEIVDENGREVGLLVIRRPRPWSSSYTEYSFSPNDLGASLGLRSVGYGRGLKTTFEKAQGGK